MSHDTQNLVGGILIIVSLIGLEWWQYRLGVSTGPWPFRSFFRYFLSLNPAAYRELDSRSFWLNIVYGSLKILIALVIVIGILGHRI